MLDPFARVVSYRSYRLNDVRVDLYHRESESISRLKRKLEGLYPALKPFTGSNPIDLLGFLSQMRDGMNTLGVCEGVAVRVLHYFLEGDARNFYASQTSPGVLSSDATRQYTWPHVINSLIKRYLQDDTLQVAYEGVTLISQRDGEDEGKYADRLDGAARACNYVFTDRELVHHYVRGLLASTRASVSEQMRRLDASERYDLAAVRRLAAAEGATFRARVKATMPVVVKPKTRLAPTMMIEEPSYAPPSSTLAPYAGPMRDPTIPHVVDDPLAQFSDLRMADPERAYEVASALEGILFAGAPASGQDPNTPTTTTSMSGGERPASGAVRPIPELTQAQKDLAMQVIPRDFWNLDCRTCRQDGHTTFTCPYLTPEQRMYCAYQYYLYQVEANPRMADYYRQRHAKRQMAPGRQLCAPSHAEATRRWQGPAASLVTTPEPTRTVRAPQ